MCGSSIPAKGVRDKTLYLWDGRGNCWVFTTDRLRKHGVVAVVYLDHGI